MSSETEFVDGLIVKAPRDGAPEFVIGSLSIKREEMIAWLQGREGDWINVDMKEAKSGKWYAAVNTWKPKDEQQQAAPARQTAPRQAAPADDFQDDDIPF